MSWGKVGVNPFILGITVILTFIGVRVITNPDLDLGTKFLFILFFLLIISLALLFEAMVKVEGEKTKIFA